LTAGGALSVVILIQGREAIPVRAIPLLTYWEVLSPDDLAAALTGEDDFNQSFRDLRAYRLDNGTPKSVPQSFWTNFVVRELSALSEHIKHAEVSHEDGYNQWRQQSLAKLPAGTFVWKDEFEACFWRKFGPDGEMTWLSGGGRGERNKSIELDFDPFIPGIDIQGMVVEGFSSSPVAEADSSGTTPSHEQPRSVACPTEAIDKPLGTKQLNTLLSIIVALCNEAKIDYLKHAQAAGKIKDMAASMGLSIGETTIEGYLKQIPNALQSRMK
jgi:hypothetical protein